MTDDDIIEKYRARGYSLEVERTKRKGYKIVMAIGGYEVRTTGKRLKWLLMEISTGLEILHGTKAKPGIGMGGKGG